MRKAWKILLSLLTACGLLLAWQVPAQAREGFDIEEHDVVMDVYEDGSVVVIETMDVHFTSQLHGIYVNIPADYDMSFEINGETKYRSYYFPVTDVKLLSDQDYELSANSHGVQIKIGSGNYYANEYETYRFTYRINMKDLDLDGLQMLFMNIISNGWDTVTDHVEFTINMPKSFDADKLYFDCDATGVTNTSSGPLVFTVSGNTIKGSYNDVLQPGQALTVQLMLDNGYFTFTSMNKFGRIAALLAGVVTVVYAILFLLFGKDDPVIESVEFHAPKGMTSAEVGVVIDGSADDSDLTSLILDWGRRGIITITDDGEDLILERVKDLEDGKEFERIMFNKLFKKGSKVKVSSLKERFYGTMNKAKASLNEYFDTKERRLFTDTSKTIRGFGVFFSFLPIALATLLFSYNYYMSWGMALELVMVEILCLLVCTGLVVSLVDLWYSRKPIIRILLVILAALLFFVACLTMVLAGLKADVAPVYLTIVVLCNIIFILLVVFMRKRTAYGSRLLGQVLGLRNFIITADEDRLKALVEENPYYFYDILPFAYALGLTNIWNDHFRNLTIPPCDWYASPNDVAPYYAMNSLSSQMSSMQSTFTTSPPSSSSGGGSVGGGGGGGGGFSGGGFGGSSGGGW